MRVCLHSVRFAKRFCVVPEKIDWKYYVIGIFGDWVHQTTMIIYLHWRRCERKLAKHAHESSPQSHVCCLFALNQYRVYTKNSFAEANSLHIRVVSIDGQQSLWRTKSNRWHSGRFCLTIARAPTVNHSEYEKVNAQFFADGLYTWLACLATSGVH